MHMPETAVSAPGKPAWADLSTTDAAAGKTFYSKLFGWQPEDQGPEAGGYVIFKLGGKQVTALGPVQNPGQPAAWSVPTAFAVMILVSLRTRDGVSASELKRFAQETNEFIALGLLRKSNGNFVLTQKGKAVADSVAEAFL